MSSMCDTKLKTSNFQHITRMYMLSKYMFFLNTYEGLFTKKLRHLVINMIFF